MIWYGLSALAVLVVAPPVVVAIWGRSMIYHPTKLAPELIEALCDRDGWQAAPLQTADTIRLTGLVSEPESSDARWLVMWGGNAMRIDSTVEVLEELRDGHDVGLAAWAYRGYDGSDGSPTEAGISADAIAVVQHLSDTRGVMPGRLVLVGQSIGSGVAAKVAAELCRAGTPPGALVLLSPYTSIASVVSSFALGLPLGQFVPDPWRTDQLVPDINCPVLIVHGTEDNLIPVSHGQQLASLFGSQATLVELRAHHNDLWLRGAKSAVRDFLRGTK